MTRRNRPSRVLVPGAGFVGWSWPQACPIASGPKSRSPSSTGATPLAFGFSMLDVMFGQCTTEDISHPSSRIRAQAPTS